MQDRLKNATTLLCRDPWVKNKGKKKMKKTARTTALLFSFYPKIPSALNESH